MPPWRSLVSTQWGSLTPRQAAMEVGNVHELADGQLRALNIASLSVASMSVGAAVLAQYWFLRMRRSFRHDLIMLLIQSDMFKAIWFLVYPIVKLVHGRIKNESAFCQASGFFLTVGIEASDVAVALIAIHSALYIFRGEQGLYPYRNYAYATFIILPLLLASLAFINNPAYTDSGEYCYLPVDPDWTRRALSWIPRYIVCLIIIIIYSCIYIYVRLLIRRFGAAAGVRRNSLVHFIGHPQPAKKPSSIPPTPPMDAHGLIPSPSASRRNSTDHPIRRDSSSTTHTLDMELPSSPSPEALARHRARTERREEPVVKWKMPHFGFDSTASTYKERLSSDPDLSSPDAVHYNPRRTSTRTESQTHNSTMSPTVSKSTTTLSNSPASSRGFWHRQVSNSSHEPRAISQPNIFDILHRGPRGATATSSTAYISATALDVTGMVKTREKIRRQLRQLIMYPLVYMAVWVIPFIVHFLGWDGRKMPFGMTLMSLLSLCVQGFVNAMVFSLKEKPWRHTRRKGQRFLFKFWCGTASQEGTRANVGRTREEMLVDGRIARRRRANELADRRTDRPSNRKTTTEWWDHIEEGNEEGAS